MIKLKLLKPSHKEKKRYIVYKVQAEQQLDMRTFQDELVSKLQSFLGVFQSAQAGIQTVKYDTKNQQGILRVNHLAVDMIKASFALIDSINKVPVTVSSKGVSGILKKAQDYM
jgi:RNase P/RNase MRP subunit POP5